MKNKSLIIVTTVLVIIIALAAIVYPSLSDKANEEMTSSEAASSSLSSDTVQYAQMKDIKIFDAKGNEINISSLKGKPMILNFWATWCGYCIQEMPDFEEAYKEYGDTVMFLMVNTDDGIENGDKFIKAKGYSFPTYYDLEYSAAITYGITGIPRTIAIDRDGNIRYNRSGMIDKATLESIIQTIK